MKHTALFSFYYIFAPILLIARVLQQFCLIDQKTGFFNQYYQELVGNIINYAFLAFFLVIAVLSVLAGRKEMVFPSQSLPLCAVSVISVACLFIGGFLEIFEGYPVVGILEMISAFSLAFFAFNIGVSRKSPGLLMLLPTVYITVRMVSIFLHSRSEATVNYFGYNMLALASAAIFFMSFVKLASGYRSGWDRCWFYFSGLACGLLCMGQFLITAISLVWNIPLHGFPQVDFSMFAFSLFSLTATLITNKKAVY